MNPTDPINLARDIMQDFARLTGLDPPASSPKRYLWTDAFAVCNYLGLYQQTDDPVYRDLALRLVDQVHHVLGKHRDDDPRRGWISGLGEKEGALHPTAGGLRIGKKHNERLSGEPYDERAEWDRDGQYYHYLTKWMHALNCVSRVTGDPVYVRWAIELARTAHARFTYVPPHGGPKRMFWKMSIDLSYPLVPSMGLHDPLDGLVTNSELEIAATRNTGESPQTALSREIADLEEMCRARNWATDDLLGIGGLLFDASRITQLMVQGGFSYSDLLESVVVSARTGMRIFDKCRIMHLPAGYRLAFRELGFLIGMKGLDEVIRIIDENPRLFKEKGSLERNLKELKGYMPIAEEIECFWLNRANQESMLWKEHQEINMVMLATSLAPGGFLGI
jgi:hypothetical protein